MRTNTGQILYIPKIGQRANLQHSLMKGCVGWWPLNDGGGDIAKDLSGNGNDGTQSGGVTWASTAIGTVASFDGVDAYFDIGDNYDYGDGTSDSPFSISGWMYLDALPAASASAALFSKLGENVGDTSGSAFSLSVNDSGVFSLRLYDDSGGNQINAVSASSAVGTGLWYHFASTYDGSGLNTGIEIYINGANSVSSRGSSGTYVAMEDESSSAKIGCSFLNNSTYKQFVDGNIQNVRIYSRALSATEILELYTNPWSGLSIPSSTRYFFVPTQVQQIFPPRMKLKTSISVGKGGRIVI